MCLSVLVIENSLVSTSRSKDPIVLQKVGELLSNMHILLLKKALKRLKEQLNGIATNLNVKVKGAGDLALPHVFMKFRF